MVRPQHAVVPASNQALADWLFRGSSHRVAARRRMAAEYECVSDPNHRRAMVVAGSAFRCRANASRRRTG